METASASDDPAQMKAAMSEAHKQLAGITEKMSHCAGMMEKKHGGATHGEQK